MGKVNILNVALISFKFILISTIMNFLKTSVATDTLTQELTIRQTLVSSDQMFELGFFTPKNSSYRYIGIWYKNITGTKPIWVANRETPLSVSDTGPVLTIGSDGNLKILNGTKKEIWSTDISSKNSNNTIAMLSDKGDLVIKDNSSGNTLWESFSYLSDSLIAGMKIGYNIKTGEKYELTSWKGENDPSPGDFVLGYTTDTPPQNFMWKGSKPHWRSGPWDGWKFVGLYKTYTGYSAGFMVTQDNQQGSAYGSYNPPSTSQVMIEYVSPDGNLKISRWDIGGTDGGVTWVGIEIFL